MKRRRLKVVVAAGARPNFIKVAPLIRALRKRFQVVFVHTGQHYDFKMSGVFFRDLGIPKPDVHLEVGSGTHGAQTAKVLELFERTLLKERPDAIVVVGDVNSTLACALAAAKMQVPVAHVEAGLRSFDRAMPEEINRIAVDRLSDFLYVTEESAIRNLRREGIPARRVFFDGNVMIDSLVAGLPAIERSRVVASLGLRPKGYAVVTMHRPSNVDTKAALLKILSIFESIARLTPVLYPVHPRARKMIESHGLGKRFAALPGFRMIEPLGYTDFLKLVKESAFVLTDSGGIQEETTKLGVPCLTMRENTERPVTVREGTNVLVGSDVKVVVAAARKAIAGKWKKTRVPRGWDGKAAERIAVNLERSLVASQAGRT